MSGGRLGRRMERRRLRRLVRAAHGRGALVLLGAAAGLAAPAALAAQRPTTPPAPTTPATPRRPAAGRDTIPRDSAGVRRDSTARRDSLGQGELVKWAAGDSVLDALRERPGYTATRYQGDRVVFDVNARVLRLAGDPSAVERGRTVVVADTIIYDDATGIVDARRGSPTDSIILRDPDRGSDDLIAGRVQYNVAQRRGQVSELATSVESGERWFVTGGRAAIVADTTGPQRVYARSGSITSCDEKVPHYHFQAQELKLAGRSLMVARPAVLYIYDVPVMWLPFVFQDMRSGRRSGILSPRFGVSELVRNSPGYRRHVENLGYYFAVSDFLDATVAFDWRSKSNATELDPGWVRASGEVRYKWLDRFMSGRFYASHQSLSAPVTGLTAGASTARTNTGFSWQHSQDFSARTKLSTNINYETSTTVRQATAFNPYTATATIASQANFSTGRGPFTLSLGGSQQQYSGRQEITRNFPSLNVASEAISVGPVTWTPTLSLSNQQTIKGQPIGAFAYRYFTNSTGRPDSSAVFRNTRASSIQFGTPLRIFNFDWRNSVTINENLNDFPDVRAIYGTVKTATGRDSSVVIENRVFARTFQTGIDWQTGIDLPQLFGGSWNITPSLNIVNVESSQPLWVRTERTGNRLVSQGKRLQYGISSAPTIFGLFRGFGPVTRFRHSLTPVLTYSYAPEAEVDSTFRNALNIVNNNSYLGGLAQSRISVRLDQTIEGKLRPDRSKLAARDTAGARPGRPGEIGTDRAEDAEGRKVKLLALNFSSIEYDFIRADSLKKAGIAKWTSGFTTPRFNYSARSDLLPGMNLDVGYSLFQGDVQSDTARFKPYRETVSLSFSVNGNSGIFAALNRVFGRGTGTVSSPELERNGPPTADDSLARRSAAQPFAGSGTPLGMSPSGPFGGPPAGQAWQASFSFSSSRQRPIVGGNVVNLTASQLCGPFQAIDPIGFQQCLADPNGFSQRFGTGLLPGVDPNGVSTTAGGQIFRTPGVTTLQSNTSFHITPKWSAQWSTTYDFQQHEFASHLVTLQRELHDWNATFAFTQAPNGNFAFNFFIALKAQPEIKFNYDRQSVRGAGTRFTNF